MLKLTECEADFREALNTTLETIIVASILVSRL